MTSGRLLPCLLRPIWRNIPGVQRRQIEHMVAEAMIEKAIREPEYVIDRARAEAALPQKIGFEVAHQFSALGLRRCQSVFKKSYAWTCYNRCDDH